MSDRNHWPSQPKYSKTATAGFISLRVLIMISLKQGAINYLSRLFSTKYAEFGITSQDDRRNWIFKNFRELGVVLRTFCESCLIFATGLRVSPS